MQNSSFQFAFRKKMIWKIKSAKLSIDCPLLMGILNLTPDSFYDGGRFFNRENALRQAVQLVEDGADLIDIGAESTRPNALPISLEQEWARLSSVLDALLSKISVPISVDTTKSEVARRVLRQGVQVINDVSGFKDDPEMAEVVESFGAGVVLMHRRGQADSMQNQTHYENLISDIYRELGERMDIARAAGISDEQIVLDPGIGFAKEAGQSFEIVNRLSEFKCFERPVMIGPSRKSFIGTLTHTGPEHRLYGTIAACVLAYERGARIFRVHDVKAVREALLVTEATLSGKYASEKNEFLLGSVPTGEVFL